MFTDLFDNFLDKIDGFESFFMGNRTVNTSENLVYGEMDKKSCKDSINILKDFCKLDGTENVLDLGSVIGKIVMAMHYTDMFKNVDGVEIVDKLVIDCKEALQLYSEKFNKNISNIHIYEGDSLKFDISNYDIIFSNTTVDDNFRKALTNKISEEAKPNCIVISSISAFESNKLKLVRRFASNFSWGESHINASIKL